MKPMWLALLVSLATLTVQPVQAAPVTDDRGVAVSLREPPRRIVTLLPSLAETVCELGACERLVGVDNFSNWPASVRGLPRVGGLDDANIERIVALRPDLVLLSTTARVLPRLESLGIAVMGLDIKTLADVERVLGKVAEVLQVPGAGRAWQRIDAGLDAAARTVPQAQKGTTVYFEVDSGPWAASESSHIGEMLTRLGVANIVPARLGSVPRLNPEYVVRADPQVIMLGDRDAPALASRPGWSRIRAVRDGRVCSFSREQGDVIARPGPRLAEAAQLLADCLAGRLKAQR